MKTSDNENKKSEKRETEKETEVWESEKDAV